MLSAISSRRRFADLSEQEILALAISSEEDDASIYRTYAERLRPDYPASAAVFDGMAAEEDTHRRKLIDLHQVRFGQVIPLIRREHVAGYYARKPVWLMETMSLEQIRSEAEAMAEAKGGQILSGVSAKLNYLVVGEDAGSKLEKAKKINTITILSEAEFLELIGN